MSKNPTEPAKTFSARVTQKIGLGRWQSTVIRDRAVEEIEQEPALRQREDSLPTTEPVDPKKPKGLFRRALFLAFLMLIAWSGWIYLGWPKVADLANKNPSSTAFIDTYTGHAGAAPQWRWVRYENISKSLKRAVLVAEDINFFHHNGFETAELKKAVNEALTEGKKLRGASTLTQQLAKNLWLSPSRNPARKLKEALLTKQLEDKLEKRRILEIYLNVVEFGPGVYGAEAAARHYFGKSAGGLTSHEAARLAASLPHSKWSPASDSSSYLSYVKRIEGRMSKAAEWIDKSL